MFIMLCYYHKKSDKIKDFYWLDSVGKNESLITIGVCVCVCVWISKYKVRNKHISKGFQKPVMFVTRGVPVHDSKFGWLPLQRLFVRQSLETDFLPYTLKPKLV
jgi:uncharacterized membrane protein